MSTFALLLAGGLVGGLSVAFMPLPVAVIVIVAYLAAVVVVAGAES